MNITVMTGSDDHHYNKNSAVVHSHENNRRKLRNE